MLEGKNGKEFLVIVESYNEIVDENGLMIVEGDVGYLVKE